MKRLRLAPVPLLAGLLTAMLLISACSLTPWSSAAEPSPTPTGPVRADFYSPETSYAGKSWVDFYSTSTGDIKEQSWDLKGDGIIDYTGPYARTFFSVDGYYTVSLTVEGWDGSTDTMTKVDYIYLFGCKT